MARTIHARGPRASVSRAIRISGYALLALSFALAQLRLIILLMPKPFVLSAEIAHGVLIGEPHWRVYQNRVLAPWLVSALGAITHADIGAYAVFTALVLFAAGFGVLALTDRLGDPRRPPLAAFLALHVLFAFLLPCLWLYAWDLLSILVFVVFNFLVLRGAGRAAFAALFAIAIFNHEIALFIAGWLVLDPFVRRVASRGDRAGGARFDRATALAGAGLLIAGFAVIEGLRRALLVREVSVPSDLPPLTVYGRSFHFSLEQNWNTLSHSFTFDPAQGFTFVVVLFLLLVVAIAIRLALADPARFGALSAVMLGMTASFLCFGLIAETRVLMPLIPFVAIHGGAVWRNPPEVES